MSKQYNMQIRASALVQRCRVSKSVKLRAYVLAVLTYSHIFQACYAQIIYVFTCLLAWCLRVCLVFYVFACLVFTGLLGVLVCLWWFTIQKLNSKISCVEICVYSIELNIVFICNRFFIGTDFRSNILKSISRKQ